MFQRFRITDAASMILRRRLVPSRKLISVLWYSGQRNLLDFNMAGGSLRNGGNPQPSLASNLNLAASKNEGVCNQLMAVEITALLLLSAIRMHRRFATIRKLNNALLGVFIVGGTVSLVVSRGPDVCRIGASSDSNERLGFRGNVKIHHRL